MDQNCYLVGYLRALYPGQPAVLGYLPDARCRRGAGRVIRYESHELALVEAWVAGGNYVLAPDARYREGLLKGAQDALTAWRRLGKTAAWLRANVALFRQPALPLDYGAGGPERQCRSRSPTCATGSTSPRRWWTLRIPPHADPRRRLVIAAAGIETPQGEVAKPHSGARHGRRHRRRRRARREGLVAGARHETPEQLPGPRALLVRQGPDCRLPGAGLRSRRIRPRPHRLSRPRSGGPRESGTARRDWSWRPRRRRPGR